MSRINNAIDIIKYAIKNNVSVKSASVTFGFSNTYVKNAKADAFDGNNNISESDLNSFKDVYNDYLESRKLVIVKEKVVEPKIVKNNQNEKLNITSNNNVMDVEWKAGDNYPVDHIKTLDQLLKATKVDLDVWSVKEYNINKWDVTGFKNDNPLTTQNFQVKARLEKAKEVSKAKQVLDIFNKMVKTYQPPTQTSSILMKTEVFVDSIFENNLLEISIFDLHIGKLAWAGETGENYDTKIARERFLYSINTLLKRAEGFQYNRILFPIGNDFFNSDTILNTTTHGTPQDEDLRWQKTFSVGCKLLVDAIEVLKQSGVIIDVMMIPGNHDFERSYYLGAFLEAWFKDDNLVNMDNGASPRKYYRYGKVLLGFTHGSEEKEDSLPLLMATEVESKQHWSDTLFHEWHLGHIHRKKTTKYTILDKNKMLAEDLGVTVRYLSSLTGTEEWHHKKGFVGQIKAADAFIWNDETGLIAQLNSNFIL